MQIFDEILEFLDKVISNIGSVGGLLYLWSIWKNRSRIKIHNAALSFKTENSGILNIELENLGDTEQSIEPIIKVSGVNPDNYKMQFFQIETNDERFLPSMRTRQFNIKIPQELLFYWYITIKIRTTKIGCTNIRFKNSNTQFNSINAIRFFIEKLIFRFQRQLYWKFFNK